MKCLKIWCTLIGLLLSGLVQAQQSDEYIYQDSTFTQPAAEEAGVEVSPPEEVPAADEATYYVDTNLVANNNILSRDSVLYLQQLKEYAYAAYLDSLLLEQKHLAEQKQSVKYDVKPNTPSVLDQFFGSSITSIVLWILAGVLVLYIVLKLFFTGGAFHRSSSRLKVKVLPEETPDANNFSQIDKLLANALSAKNYKLATRYLYLQLLQRLSESGAIGFTVNKTNSDYLRELAGKAYKPEFAILTRNYEYIWYGDFPVTEEQFNTLQLRFNQLNKQL